MTRPNQPNSMYTMNGKPGRQQEVPPLGNRIERQHGAGCQQEQRHEPTSGKYDGSGTK
jgi:hypothetical protein